MWVDRLQEQTAAGLRAVLQTRPIEELATGKLPVAVIRTMLVQFYPLIEIFPKLAALNLARAPDPAAARFLMENIHAETRHAQYWLDMGVAFGVPRDAMLACEPVPEVDTLNNWLWTVAYRGTFGEAVSATHFALESAAGQICRRVEPGLQAYGRKPGVTLTGDTFRWVREHAKYDDQHPAEALEIIMRCADTTLLQERVERAAGKSLDYLRLALDACYEGNHGQEESA
jgi:pyrroloquinoline quinone (PQQ) biosynthesis protein C